MPSLAASVKQTTSLRRFRRPHRFFESLVNGKLVLRLLQFNCDVHLGPAYVVVFTKRAVAPRNHLYPYLAKRDAGGVGLPVIVGLQLQTFLLDPALFVQKMENDFSVLYRFAVRFSD